MAEKSQRTSWLPQAPGPNPELRNEHPHYVYGVQVRIPFMASLWIWHGLGWPKKAYESELQTYQERVPFKALDKVVIVTP